MANYTFLKKFLAETCPFWFHWYLCFGFLVTSPLDFKARVGSALFRVFFCGGECNVHSLRSTSGATCANLLHDAKLAIHENNALTIGEQCSAIQNFHNPLLQNFAICTSQPVTYPHACADVGHGSDLNGQSPGQKTNVLPLCQRPGLASYT